MINGTYYPLRDLKFCNFLFFRLAAIVVISNTNLSAAQKRKRYFERLVTFKLHLEPGKLVYVDKLPPTTRKRPIYTPMRSCISYRKNTGPYKVITATYNTIKFEKSCVLNYISKDLAKIWPEDSTYGTERFTYVDEFETRKTDVDLDVEKPIEYEV